MEETGETDLKLRAGVGSRLGDREQVLVQRVRLSRRCDGVADRRLELRDHLHQRAGVPCEPERHPGSRAEEELRELAHAVFRNAAADPLARDVP